MSEIAGLLLAALAPTLGSELRQDGYSIRPPADFRMERMGLLAGTRVGAVAPEGSADERRALSAALVDGQGADAAAMLIAHVDGSFAPGPAARDEFSTQVVRHFRQELGLALTLERADYVSGPDPRIEVVGSIRHEGQLRSVLVAAMPGEGRHAVITFSVPTGRFDEILPRIEESLATYRSDPVVVAGFPRGLVGAALGALVGSAFVSSAILRRRAARRAAR